MGGRRAKCYGLYGSSPGGGTIVSLTQKGVSEDWGGKPKFFMADEKRQTIAPLSSKPDEERKGGNR